MDKPLVYISGKIAGLDPFETETKFRRAAMSMRRKGYDVVNPFIIPGCRAFDWADYILRDFDHFDSSAIAYAWFIWEKGYKGETILKFFN